MESSKFIISKRSETMKGVETRGKIKKQDQMKGRDVDKTKEDGDELSGVNQLAESMRCGLDSVSKEIRDPRADVKKDMNSLKEQITEDVKMEIKELNKKYTNN